MEDAHCVSSRPLLFALNGRRVEIASPDPSMTLISFLRSHAHLTGTKLSCGEGGCGACLVLLATYDPIWKKVHQHSINSCLALLCSLDGCSITTIEGLGSTRTTFHAIQQRIAGFHGSQCGFCTPGMCISLYSCLHNCRKTPSAGVVDTVNSCMGNGSNAGPHALHTLPTLSCEAAQKAIVGNICRCTGYRPIVDTCKSFAGDVDVEDLGINSFWASIHEANTELLPPYSSAADSGFPEFLMEELYLRQNRANTEEHKQHVNGYPSPPQALNLNVKFRGLDAKGEEKIWIQTSNLDSVFKALHSFQGRSDVKLVVGNTSSGYYKDQRPLVLVDIGRVPELLVMREVSGFLTVGAAVTIEKLINMLEASACLEDSERDDASIAYVLASHLQKVANPHVRHRASVGGNLIMAQQFHFDSDLATLFLAAGATLRIIAAGSKSCSLSMEEFLQRGILEPGWLLESVSIPLQFVGRFDASRNMPNGNSTGAHHVGNQSDLSSKQCYFKSYRASPRNLGNALAQLNAAFLATTSSSDADQKVVDVRLAFGAFGGAHAIRVHRVESFLSGKVLNSSVLLEAISILKDELKPSLSFAKRASYKLSLAVDYLSCFFLPLFAASNNTRSSTVDSENGFLPGAKININPQFNGGGVGRMCISGKQILPDLEEEYLIHKAMEKSEAKIQASGEAVYVDDIPSPDQCLFAAFVLSTKAAAKIKHIDTKEALASPGAVAFISADDIPEGGSNVGGALFFAVEKLFADNFAEYVGHPLGIMVADSPEHAKAAADRIKVHYSEECSPILCIEDAVAKDSLFSVPPFIAATSTGNVEQGFSEAEHQILDAEVKTGSQYYFYMETQTALAIPEEDNCIVIYSSCQSTEILQKSVSMCLGLPHHNVRIITRRVGGGFGGKATRNIAVASACALAAFKLQRPVRMYLDRKTDMLVMGGRHPTKTQYSVAFKADGKVTGLTAKIFIDGGWSEDLSPGMPFLVEGGLKKYNWGSMALEFTVCKTNLSSKSAMRGPGHVQGSFIADTVLEHVAAVLGLDVHLVITRNMHSLDSVSLFFSKTDMTGGIEGFTLPSMWDRMLNRVEENVKDVTSFNAANVWLKRGLSVLPSVYEVGQSPKPAKVSIFHDGSIVVEVGGIELGQGLWTKVKQATVHGLGPLITPKTAAASMKVRVVQADSISMPHGGLTAGSTASEGSCEAVRQACRVLVDRLFPLKVKKEEESAAGISWNDLIKLAEHEEVNLSAHVHWFPSKITKNYLNYGVAATQVELDTLTGAVTILWTDIFYDCGKSMNPAVDIGQIEGSFVQGIGFFLTEELEVDDKGALTTTGTWTYKPPTVDNIPQKFVVEMENSVAHKNRILSSKACGEPPLLLAGTVHSAVRRAIEAAREAGQQQMASSPGQDEGKERFFQFDIPASMERVKKLCGLERLEEYLRRHGAVLA
ncbi:hypothetical protein GOP47_0000049 [Adiantum capillus-veneris]|uniref:Uncharacterized protein n=1 Tax=Adiantum capillus-veneris TaxID=13818 RepID=A0A9D4VCA7_ADICA|nr:hypothetical protein GOP47_0000049 [Adiantum capillus-veneris]